MTSLEINFNTQEKAKAGIYLNLISIINYQLKEDYQISQINTLINKDQIRLIITPESSADIDKIHSSCVQLARAINQEIALSELCYSEYHLMMLKQQCDFTALQISLLTTTNTSESGSFDDPEITAKMNEIYSDFLESVREARSLEASI
jgi:hypothetical protein